MNRKQEIAQYHERILQCLQGGQLTAMEVHQATQIPLKTCERYLRAAWNGGKVTRHLYQGAQSGAGRRPAFYKLIVPKGPAEPGGP